MPREVFEAAISRAGRQPGSILNLQITQNPADEKHWTSELIDEPEDYLVTDDGTVITKRTFHIQKGENKFLTSLQRAANMAAFKNDPGKWARYVEGKVASVSQGIAVTPNYGETFHFSQKILPVFPKLDAFRFWDGYQHPCCIVAQWNQIGQMVVHECLEMPGYGVKELIQDKLNPLLLTPKFRDKMASWRDIGDPSMRTPDQSTVRMTAAKTIEMLLKTRFEPGPTRWNNRIEPVINALTKIVANGLPLIVVSASASLLHKALKGGWHYKKDNNGKRLGDMPVKNDSDHPGMAFAYGISILMPYSVREDYKKNKAHVDRIARMKRAASYGSGGASTYSLPGQVINAGRN